MERYALDVILGLIDQGHDVTALCRKSDPAAPGMERVPDVRVVPSSFIPGKFRDQWFSWNIDRMRKRMTPQPQAHIACGMIAHPDVCICGGTHRGYLAAIDKTPGFFDKRKITLETKQYENARVIIAHSRLMRDELLSLYGVSPEKIRLLHPPVNAARFSPPTAEERARLRDELGFQPERKYFLFPSGGHERKGLPFLRRFFETTDLPVELVVAGRPVEPGKNIRHLGYVRDMERLYRAADATTLASAYEPFGLVGVESVLCGTPVVFPANMGCCEVLSPPMLAQFRPGDMEDFHRALRAAMAYDRTQTPDPRTAVGYDCGVRHHVEELIAGL